MAFVHSQNRVSGTVKDKTDGSAIAYATVTLLRNDSTVVTGEFTDDTGTFVLKDVRQGNYLLQITYLGYDKKQLQVNVPQQNELGDIAISPSENKLQELVVNAKRPLIVQRTDRYIVNVGSNIQTAGRNALEVLGTTPGVFVDPDGNISVMGKSVDVYIDGRPSRLSGEQLKAMLSATNGETIDRIEVITNPSARYDASGGSIIDIKTKTGLQPGINGSADLGYRQGHRDNENAGLSLNFRDDKVNLYGNYSINRTSQWQRFGQTNSLSEDDGVVHTFDQQGNTKSVDANFSQQYRLGVDYNIDKKNVIGALFSGYHTGDAENIYRGTTQITPALNDTSSTAFMNRNSAWNDGKQYNLNYQGQYAKPGQQLNIDLDYGQFQSKPYQLNQNDYFDLQQTQLGGEELLRHTNPQKIDLWSVKADYTQPLWKDAKIETGAKVSRSKTDNNLIFEDYLQSQWELDATQSNRFIYTEQIDAAYASISQSLGKWNFQAGLRGEYTHSKGEQRTVELVTDSTYFNLFPSAYVSYALSEKHNFNMAYGRRIIRPVYSQLNPFEYRIDAYSFQAGNPYLKPMIMDDYSFSYMNNPAGLMFRFGYYKMHNLMQQTPVQEGDRYGMTFNNFGERSSYSIMVNYRKTFFNRWTMNLMMQGMYDTNSSDESYGTFNNNKFVYEAQWYNSVNITSTFSAEMTALYVSPQTEGYYVAKSMANVSAGLRKTFLKDKLSVSLNANDLFHTFKANMTAKNETMDYHVWVDRDSRWISLSLHYQFGSDKIKDARRRDTGVEDEKQRIR
jgi:hypothetical protein